MRRILTSLGITALLALVASPAMARPNNPNGRNDRTPTAQRGWVADRDHGSLRVERVAPAPYIAPAKLHRAKALRSQYVAQKTSLLRQIQTQRQLIRALRSTPAHSRARVRANLRQISAAERRLERLEVKLSSLELMYTTRLTRLMPPAAARYFQLTFG
ncbi:MAG: hypothetical protein CVU56_24665 [Deltaproteobacteria bacterium HGW-Deltaproteobacteria-14]|jgi:hypothetical protein|nr:MAG: hypothetical protein CVU56_24665 [Deltaproteobacteria bacterium HGW-Deltaproteobacteria-14]